MNNENMSSGKGLTPVKTTLLSGQERVTVVAYLPTNPSCDVTANIPIYQQIWILQIFSHFLRFFSQNFDYFTPKITIFGLIQLCVIANIVS